MFQRQRNDKTYKSLVFKVLLFTFTDGMTVYCDLSKDPDICKGKGDYQFQVYRLMRKENRYNKSCSVTTAWPMTLTCQGKPWLLKRLEINKFAACPNKFPMRMFGNKFKAILSLQCVVFSFSTTMKPLTFFNLMYTHVIFGTN